MASSAYLPFQRYDEEFQSLTRQVEQSLQREEQDGFVDEPGNTASSSTLIGQCDELLQQMALEARSVPDASMKRDLLSQVRTCKSTLQRLKDQSERQSLLASGRKSNGSSAAHRERLLQQQDQLMKQNSQLENAKRMMEETEQVALEITTELGHNRETLESAHGRIHQVQSLTGRARRIVQSMNQRAVQQKIMLYGVSGSIVVVFVFLVWFLFLKEPKNNKPKKYLRKSALFKKM